MDCNPPGFSVHGIFQAEYWSGLPFPSPRDLPNPGIKLASPALQADSLLLSCQGRPFYTVVTAKPCPLQLTFIISPLSLSFFFWVMFLLILSRNLNQDKDLKTILYGIFIHSPLLSLKLRRQSVSLHKSKSLTFALASLINSPVATYTCQSVYETLSQEHSITHWLLAFRFCSATFY